MQHHELEVSLTANLHHHFYVFNILVAYLRHTFKNPAPGPCEGRKFQGANSSSMPFEADGYVSIPGKIWWGDCSSSIPGTEGPASALSDEWLDGFFVCVASHISSWFSDSNFDTPTKFEISRNHSLINRRVPSLNVKIVWRVQINFSHIKTDPSVWAVPIIMPPESAISSTLI